MTTRITMDLPSEQPIWAIGSGRIIKPNLTEINDGYKLGYEPPARKDNWLQYYQNQWLKRIGSLSLMNLNNNAVINASLDSFSALFHPGIGYWCVSGGAVATNYYSTDGYNWTAGNSVASPSPFASFQCIDSNYYIFADPTSYDMKYSADAGQTAWSTIATATIGGAGRLFAMDTKYPDSDFAVLIRGQSGDPQSIRIASSGITGSWAAATTQPTFASGAQPSELIYTGSDNTWLLLSYDPNVGPSSRLHKSTDDGDNWAQVTGMALFPASSYGAAHMAFNRTTGRLAIGGSIATSGEEEYIAYSDDMGDTWTVSTFDLKGIAKADRIRRLYYCGGSCWMALASASVALAYMSYDNAETWRLCDLGAASASTDVLRTIACDGRKIMIFGDDGINVNSLAL